MNVSKILAAAVAATSIVGAVGLSYAQTTSDTPVVPANPSTTLEPSTQAPAEGSQGTQSGATSAPSDTGSAGTPTEMPAATEAPSATDSGMASEPAPKADRN